MRPQGASEPPAPSSSAPSPCGRLPSSPERASTPRSLRHSTLGSDFREWGPGGAGRRRSLESRGPLPSRPRVARPPGPRGNRAAVAGAFVRTDQAPKGSVGKPASARPHATPPRPASRRLSQLTFWMAAGVISPLPRCLGAANATDMLPPSPRSASPERSGGSGAGGPTPASGQSHLSARGGGGCSGAARLAGRFGLNAELQPPVRSLKSTLPPVPLEPRVPQRSAPLPSRALRPHPRFPSLMVAPRRPPPPGRSGNGPATAGGSGTAAL